MMNLRTLLAAADKSDLIDLLIDLAADGEEVIRQILFRFSDATEKQELRHAAALIHEYIENNMDEDGFLDPDKEEDALAGALTVLDKARALSAQGYYLRAVSLAVVVIKEITRLMQHIDYPELELAADMVYCGFELFEDILKDPDADLKVKESVFNRLLQEAGEPRWGTGEVLSFLHAGVPLAYLPEFRRRLEDFMQAIVDSCDPEDREFWTESLAEVRYEIIEATDSEADAAHFVEQHLEYKAFRQRAIVKALRTGDYQRVIDLASEGERLTEEKGSWWQANNWRVYRYRAYTLAGRLAEQRQLAREFAVKGDYTYYEELKATYDAAEWLMVYPGVLDQMKGRPVDTYLRATIAEEDWPRLWGYVQTNPPELSSYYQHLVPEYREEVIALFLSLIGQAAGRANSRSGYKQVCRLIAHLSRAGGQDQAKEVVQTLLAKNPRRPAFREELFKLSELLVPEAKASQAVGRQCRLPID